MGRAALTFALLAAACGTSDPSSSSATDQSPRWGIVIHTGAGDFTLASLGDRQELMRAAMTEALAAGHRVLAEGGASLDAVQAAIVVLEDSPEFNAGKGAVFTHEGTNELDASIMDGATRRAGAVAGVKRIKNPILLARLVMEKSAARDDDRRRRRGIRRRTGWDRVRGTEVLPHRAGVGRAAARARSGTPEGQGGRLCAAGHGARCARCVLRNGGRGRSRPSRQSCRWNVHGRDDQQTIWSRRRLAHRRRRHLREQRELRHLVNRTRRVLHPLQRGA